MFSWPEHATAATTPVYLLLHKPHLCMRGSAQAAFINPGCWLGNIIQRRYLMPLAFVCYCIWRYGFGSHNLCSMNWIYERLWAPAIMNKKSSKVCLYLHNASKLSGPVHTHGQSSQLAQGGMPLMPQRNSLGLHARVAVCKLPAGNGPCSTSNADQLLGLPVACLEVWQKRRLHCPDIPPQHLAIICFI